MKVALVYDRINKWGGAERVLQALHEMYPDAPLYTSLYNPQSAPWSKHFKIHTSYLQHIPGASTSHEYYATLMPTAFEQFTFDAYDLVISVTSEAAKGIITKPHTKHICYCLTPTRYLWSGYDTYFSPLLKFIAAPAVSYLRKWDRIASKRPDVMIGISREVQRRIKTFYGLDTPVIYPPVVELPRHSKSTVTLPEKPYFLVVSRFVPYKRVDLAIKACSELNLPLVVIGSGSERKKLVSMAGPTIQFVGNASDSELAEYYANCLALLFPGDEDFGITIVEAQMFGKPVIAFKKGGALETIVDGVTGTFFSKQTVSSLKEVLRTFNGDTFSPQACMKQAEKFSKAVFMQEFSKMVEQLYKKD